MGWDERNDEYLIEFTEQELAEHDAEIRADAIKEYHDKLSKEMHDLWRFYKADTNNRPKPNFMCAYSMADLIAEQLKSQDSMK